MEKIGSNYNENILKENYLKIKLDPNFSALVKKFKVPEKEIINNLSSFEETL